MKESKRIWRITRQVLISNKQTYFFIANCTKLRINLITFLFLNHYSAMSLTGNTGTNILKNYENSKYFTFLFTFPHIFIYDILYIFRDACKHKVLPGIAKKPQGFSSLQLLTTARNEKKNQRFSNLLEIVDTPII